MVSCRNCSSHPSARRSAVLVAGIRPLTAGRILEKFVTPAHQAEFTRQHRAFVEAIRNRDPKASEMLMRAHLEHVRQLLFGVV